MQKAMLVLIVGVLAGGLAAAGCGGDDNDTTSAAAGTGGTTTSTTSGPPLSKADYVGQANAICQQGNEDIAQQAKEQFGDSAPSGSDAENFIADVVVPNFEGQLEDLRALSPPKGDEETVAKVYDELESAIEKVRDDPSLAVSSDPFTEATRLAHDYGLTGCGSTF
jgi:hypothetical protein